MLRFPLALTISFFVTLLTKHRSHAFVVSVAEDQEIEVISNPHNPKQATGCGAFLDKLLQPNQIILHPMITQADTFQELTYARVLTVPVPIYSMKQPARLSPAELHFDMVLVKELGTNSKIQEVPYPMEKAMDSWFPGYYWAPLVMPCREGWQHVGWKFTSVNDDNFSPYSHFYALLIQRENKEEKTKGLRVAGFRAPGWMVTAVLS